MVNEGKKRILEIAYKNKLGHLSSYLSCYDIIDHIHEIKNSDDIFILSCGHASLALYVVIEKYYNIKQNLILRIRVNEIKLSYKYQIVEKTIRNKN